MVGHFHEICRISTAQSGELQTFERSGTSDSRAVFFRFRLRRHAIREAYEENQVQTAKNYEEQAQRLMRSYDRRVYTQVSRYMDHMRLKYLFLSTGCMIFGAILAFLHLKREGSGKGLLILSILSIFLSCLAGALAGLATWKKEKNPFWQRKTIQQIPYKYFLYFLAKLPQSCLISSA